MRKTALVYVLGLAGTMSLAFAGAAVAGLEVDYANLVSRADLQYDKPVGRSEEGMPLGNGRMGSLVWTVPAALRLQINRVDVFSCNCASNAFPERNTDYCGGCAFVDLEFAGYDADVFTDASQHLSCHDALVTVKGRDVEVRALAWHERDVMAFEVTDRRARPDAIRVNLRMLRPPVVRTMGHTARSRLDTREGRIILTQVFEEADYYCGSAVIAGVVGRNAKIRQTRDDEMSLVIEPGNGSFTVLISNAASFDKNERITDPATVQLAAAAIRGFAGLVESNKAWWHNFWSKSFVSLHSADGVADSVEQNYTYYLYVMASSSRGKYPTKFNGMLWTTGGDTRKWGGHYWGANQSCIYHALLPTNRLELLDPMFDMYSGMYESCATASRQQWGSQGLFIPETVAFDGLAKLPDRLAAEMRDLYLLKKPWEQRSEKFREYAGTKLGFSSRWNWMGGGTWENGRWAYTERGSGPYGPVTHIFSRGAKIAYLYWLRYEYTMDPAWLRDRAYPMLKGVAEFYRNYPNVKKGPDGKYHLHHVNSNEPVWGGQDTDEELSAMDAILPVVIKASEILNVDAEMRLLWREMLDNLAPLPQSQRSPPTWVKALEPVAKGSASSLPDGNTMPMWFFDLCTLENSDPETMKIANATYDAYHRNGVNAGTRVGVLSKVGVTAAMMGRADHVRYLLPNQINSQESAVLANRMDLREGTQTTSAQRLGRAADTLHNALCQSVPAGPGKTPVIRVFPAWPKEWDAAFTLLTRGAFLVSSSMKAGRIEFVQVKSQAGGECRLRNPWPDMTVTLQRDGNRTQDFSGEMLAFATAKGESITVAPKGTTPPSVRTPAATNAPAVADAATAAAPDAHLDYPPGKAPRLWSIATAETIMARWPDYNLAYHASWTSVHGYALYGFDMLYRATGDKRFYDFIKRYIDKHVDENGNFLVVVDGRKRERPTSFGNLDNMMTGNTLVMLYEYTRDERYKKAADTIRRALDDYPRNNDCGFRHPRGMHGQMWIDGIFMGQMFLTRYGKSIGDTQYCWDEATKQMTVYAKRAARDGTGLYLHGIYEPEHGDRVCNWADPKTGRSPEVWSEGLGWYALIAVETLADLPKDHPKRVEIASSLRSSQ